MNNNYDEMARKACGCGKCRQPEIGFEPLPCDVQERIASAILEAVDQYSVAKDLYVRGCEEKQFEAERQLVDWKRNGHIYLAQANDKLQSTIDEQRKEIEDLRKRCSYGSGGKLNAVTAALIIKGGVLPLAVDDPDNSVAFVAVQALLKQLTEKDATIERLESELTMLRHD